jgi:hypothetical protein
VKSKTLKFEKYIGVRVVGDKLEITMGSWKCPFCRDVEYTEIDEKKLQRKINGHLSHCKVYKIFKLHEGTGMKVKEIVEHYFGKSMEELGKEIEEEENA